jgi:hypothetical protein
MSSNSVALNELSEFLDPQGRLDLKSLAIQTLLSLTASKEGRHLLLSQPDSSLLSRICRLVFEDVQESIRFDSLLFLINLTSDNELSILNNHQLSISNDFWLQLLKVKIEIYKKRDLVSHFSIVLMIVNMNMLMLDVNFYRTQHLVQ